MDKGEFIDMLAKKEEGPPRVIESTFGVSESFTAPTLNVKLEEIRDENGKLIAYQVAPPSAPSPVSGEPGLTQGGTADTAATCQRARPGEGDCEHWIGLPATFDETTTDHYGKPNGWCWFCWQSHRIASLLSDRERLTRELEKMRADAERWRAIKNLVRQNAKRAGLGGGVILCAMDANEHDAAWASIQAIDHENPRNTLWMSEAESLDVAVDAARASLLQSEDD